MFDPREFIEDLVGSGIDREEAVLMAKDELRKRRSVCRRTGKIAENDYENREPKPTLNLNWGHK